MEVENTDNQRHFITKKTAWIASLYYFMRQSCCTRTRYIMKKECEVS